MFGSTAWIAIYGAGLSTSLFLIKIQERSEGRVRLRTYFASSTSAEQGNDLLIANVGKTPALIVDWQLVWAKRVMGLTVFDQSEWSSEGDPCNLTIKGPGFHTITFCEADYFRMREQIDGHQVKLYLRIRLAGRRSPMWLNLWPYRYSLTEWAKTRIERLAQQILLR